MMNRKLRYLVKWEGFGVEHNSWEPWDNLHAPERVADFHRKHPGAARHIRAVDFNSIPFHSYSPSVVSGRHYLKGGVCQGTVIFRDFPSLRHTSVPWLGDISVRLRRTHLHYSSTSLSHSVSHISLFFLISENLGKPRSSVIPSNLLLFWFLFCLHISPLCLFLFSFSIITVFHLLFPGSYFYFHI